MKFFKDFTKCTDDWDLIREPEALEAGDSIIFPDFAIKHRTGDKYWLLEIIGYWTENYLKNKIDRLNRANVNNIILCIDEKLFCGKDKPSLPGKVIFFKNRIKPEEVLNIINKSP